MKVLILLVLAAVAYANVDPYAGNTAYGYISKYAIPLAEKIRQAEEQMSQQRIVSGTPSQLGAFPYQAGILAQFVGISGTGVCGGSLVSANRVVTAAHCWFDGIHQAWVFTVVLGSTTLFTGGTRHDSSAVALHPSWFPALARNDVAVVYLPTSVAFSDTISPINLPSGDQLNDDFVGVTAVASGFGLTSDNGGISTQQVLSHVSLNVISNRACSFAFPLLLSVNNICTSGVGGVGVCSGDSGGPLAIPGSDGPVMIGITSFGSPLGCESFMPAAYARVTSFMDFLNQHI